MKSIAEKILESQTVIDEGVMRSPLRDCEVLFLDDESDSRDITLFKLKAFDLLDVLQKLVDNDVFFFPDEDYMKYVKTNDINKRDKYAKKVLRDVTDGGLVEYVKVAGKMVYKDPEYNEVILN